MNIVWSIVAIVLSAVPAIVLSHLAVSYFLGEGVVAALVTVFFGLVFAVALFTLITSLMRKIGWFK